MHSRDRIPSREVVEEATLDKISTQVITLDTRTHRQSIAIMVLVVALIVATSGWWLTARDNSATEYWNRVQDCRASELAKTLDQFQVIVSSSSSEGDRDQAAKVLSLMATLKVRYEE